MRSLAGFIVLLRVKGTRVVAVVTSVAVALSCSCAGVPVQVDRVRVGWRCSFYVLHDPTQSNKLLHADSCVSQ